MTDGWTQKISRQMGGKHDIVFSLVFVKEAFSPCAAIIFIELCTLSHGDRQRGRVCRVGPCAYNLSPFPISLCKGCRYLPHQVLRPEPHFASADPKRVKESEKGVAFLPQSPYEEIANGTNFAGPARFQTVLRTFCASMYLVRVPR